MCIRDSIKPLLSRLTALLGTADNPAEEIVKRIHIETVGAREFHLDNFQAVGSALLRRKPVSYTHLDVYKRQVNYSAWGQ